MHVIRVRNVNDAYVEGLKWLYANGQKQDSRAGQVLVSPVPVCTMYAFPLERILWDAKRNANPFFHLAESLWMLAGHNDARWLDNFVSDFSSRFAESNGNQHGAYGFRWREHFELEGGGTPATRLPDQLNTIVQMLRTNPLDRQAVLTMWDPMADLAVQKKDVPCNTHAYFRVRGRQLDLTVCCRSNDLVWGAYGANAVHFSFLQEYMAARLELGMGFYYQISNNFHGYIKTLPVTPNGVEDLYKHHGVTALGVFTDPDKIDADLALFFKAWELQEQAPKFYNVWLHQVAWPMLKLYKNRADVHETFLEQLQNHGTDWEIACSRWLDRFQAKQREKANDGK